MPKKRRKLSAELEKEISIAKQKVELITAKIYDIDEEEIQGDYLIAFAPIKNTINTLSSLYIQVGKTPESEQLLEHYKKLIIEFELEYEV